MDETLFRTIESSYVYLERGHLRHREVLLIQRANTGFFDGLWCFPAGRLEMLEQEDPPRMETPLEAGIREAKEEVGVEIDRYDLRLIRSLGRVAEEGDHLRMDHLLYTRRWRGEPVNNEPHRASDIGWFKLDGIYVPLAPMMITLLKNSSRQ
jgi:8-oxo-dGTP diphosphatase